MHVPCVGAMQQGGCRHTERTHTGEIADRNVMLPMGAMQQGRC